MFHSCVYYCENNILMYYIYCIVYYYIDYLNDPAVQEALHVRTIPNTTVTATSSSTASTAGNTTNTNIIATHNIQTTTIVTTTGHSADPHTTTTTTSTEPSTTTTTTTTDRIWDYCSNPVNRAWAFNDYLADTTHLYRVIYTHPHKPEGFKMLVYSGDVDGVSV